MEQPEGIWWPFGTRKAFVGPHGHRVRAAELAQTGAGRGRARGEQAEREHESTCTLLEHDPDFITRGPRAGEENEDGSSRNIVDASVVLGSWRATRTGHI